MSRQNILICIMIWMVFYSPACTQAPTQPPVEPPVVEPVPTPDPVPPAPVDPAPAPQPVPTAFEVYPGCAAPSATFTKTIFVDSMNGNDVGADGGPLNPFKTFVGAKLLGGEHVVVMPGDYGQITQKTIPGLNSGKWTWLDFQKGATSGFVAMTGVSKVILTGLEASGKAQNKYVIDFAKSSDIVIANNAVMSVKAMPTTAADWMALSSGISFDGSRCVSVLNNKIQYVRHGLAPGKQGLDPATNSAKQLIKGNVITDFSGDGARMNGSDLMFIGNTFKDGHVGQANGDGNHDDMIQGFKLDGGWYENILVEGNTFIDNASANKVFPTEYQGVCIFDGVFKKITVRKNILLVGAYHGISLNGVTDGLIENNTVISTSSKGLWIRSGAGKKGEPVVNMVVKNNLATKLVSNNWTVNTNNFAVANPANEFVQFDKVNGVFDMHLKQTSQFFGKGAGAF